jgi:DNA replication and repair protein RecF
MLTELRLGDFRCFESEAITLEPGWNFFVGPNGEGKTSVVEGVCVLLRLQSPRSSSLLPLIRIGSASFGLSGTFDRHELRFSYAPVHRRLQFDGVDQRATAQYLRLGRVVWFGNTDIELVRGSSEFRRRYLDFVGSQTDERYRPTLRAYERALRSRNALLKAVPVRPREIAAYDAPLIEHGTELGRLRNALVDRLSPLISEAYAEICDGKEQVEIRFAPGNGPDFAAHLAQTGSEHARLRQTTIGPHRDDVVLTINSMGAQLYGSEGQQRTFALAMKLAQVRLFEQDGNMPVLLVDDIFGELDRDRRRALFAALPAQGQKLVTSTTSDWPEGLSEAAEFELRNRQIKRVS